MRDYWLTQDLLKAAGFGLLALAALGVVLALWLPRKWWQKGVALAVVLFLISIPVLQGVKEVAQEQKAVDDYKERYAKAKALFDERCKTAGEKIYKTVGGIEGLLLLRIRSDDMVANRANPNWPDAALPNEAGGDEYIRKFLYWEHNGSPAGSRGYLNSNSNGATSKGYKYVEVKSADGSFSRYELLNPNNPSSTELKRTPIPKPTARYAVDFVNQVEAEDRKQWVAGTTITITDTKIGTVIAQRQSYSFEPGLGSTAGFRAPWGFAITCPTFRGWDSARTRYFVDQILKTKQEE